MVVDRHAEGTNPGKTNFQRSYSVFVIGVSDEVDKMDVFVEADDDMVFSHNQINGNDFFSRSNQSFYFCCVIGKTFYKGGPNPTRRNIPPFPSDGTLPTLPFRMLLLEESYPRLICIL